MPLGSYRVEGLPPKPAGAIEIEVHFDFDLNGILTVTTTEKGKGQQGTLVVNHAGVQRLSSHELTQARADLEALFESDETIDVAATETAEGIPLGPELVELLNQAQKAMDTLDDEQSEELQDLLEQIEQAIANQETDAVPELQEELSDFLYYVTTNNS